MKIHTHGSTPTRRRLGAAAGASAKTLLTHAGAGIGGAANPLTVTG